MKQLGMKFEETPEELAAQQQQLAEAFRAMAAQGMGEFHPGKGNR